MLNRDNTTVYITRSCRNNDQYMLFLECLEHVCKYLPCFSIVVIRDNEDKDFSEYDRALSVQFINSEFKGFAQYLPFYYHLQNHPTEYMLYVHDCTLLHSWFDFEEAQKIVDTYGVYHLSLLVRDTQVTRNNVHSEPYYHMNIVQQMIPQFFPKLERFKGTIFCSQGNQCFTNWTTINKVNNEFDLFKLQDIKLDKSINLRYFRLILEYFYAECAYVVNNAKQLKLSHYLPYDTSHFYFVNRFNHLLDYKEFLKIEKEGCISEYIYFHMYYDRK